MGMRFLKVCVVVCFVFGLFNLLAGKRSISLVSAQNVREATAEAPTGFDNRSNGAVNPRTFRADRQVFEKRENIDDGLGPVFNGASCIECHGGPVTGGDSRVLVVRSGKFDGVNFIPSPGGSLIHAKAINAAIQERLLPGYDVVAMRRSLSTLGDGYVEAIDDNALYAIASQQPAESNGRIAGQVIQVPILEAPGATRAGRFGWKNVHASLVSFAGDAYLNEMGITTPMFPNEDLSNGRSVAAFDRVPDPDEADNDDIETFARFMRATKAPSRDDVLASTSDSQSGESLFASLGCAICHVTTFTTMPAGTMINGGTFTIPEAIGDKTFHPYSDFLLHDVGTGDGIVQNGGQETRNKIRTAPLWGLRTRGLLLHDGSARSPEEAIQRHSGEASYVIDNYRALSRKKQTRLITFLRSL
jgi:CxxC motif-containing protein (DUF1111 family)